MRTMTFNEYQTACKKTLGDTGSSFAVLGLGVAANNIRKLKERYPEGFSSERSKKR